MTRAPHAVRMRPPVKAGDQPLIDVMVHDGLYCSIADAGMGGMSDAENLRLGISREAQDRFAASSHRRAAAAEARAGRGDRAARRPRARRGHPAADDLRGARGAPARVRRDGTITAGNAQPGLRRGGRRADHDRGPGGSTPLAEIVGRAVVAGPTRRCTCAPPRRPAAARAPRPPAARHRAVGDQRGVRRRRVAAAEALEIDLERSTSTAARSRSATRWPAAACGSSSRSPTSCAAAAAASGSRRCAAAAAKARRSAAPSVGSARGRAGHRRGPVRARDGRRGARGGPATRWSLGRPMGFWREHMPAGMFLRSGPDWHLDAADEHTLERFLAARRSSPSRSRSARFLDYAEWFQARDGPRAARRARDGAGAAGLRRHARERRAAHRRRSSPRRASRTSPTAPRGRSACPASTRAT